MRDVKIHPSGRLYVRIHKNGRPAAFMGGFQVAQRIFEQHDLRLVQCFWRQEAMRHQPLFHFFVSARMRFAFPIHHPEVKNVLDGGIDLHVRHAGTAPVPAPVRKHIAAAFETLQERQLFRRHLRINQIFRFMDKVKKIIGQSPVHRHESRKRRSETDQIILAYFRCAIKCPADCFLDKFCNAVIE